MVEARLALAKSFLEAYSRLPRALQKKVREFTERFHEDPTRSGLNFERLAGARDPKVRSLRIDQAYRVIVVQPDRGDVILCVWVDHHDEAYRWVERKVFEVNPLSGVLQVYSVEEGSEALTNVEAKVESEARGAARPAKPLFAKFDDEELLLAGVPQPLLASVRELQTDVELDALAPHLPADAADMLYLLAAGYDFMQALEEASRPKEKAVAVDTGDFATALDRPETQSVFHLVEGEEELEKMLDAPLEQWRVFLHPSQRRLVERSVNGPTRVLGGAGTGKTVVLMHRAKFLAERVFNAADDRIFVTTFTRNLAIDLESNLATLCPGAKDRIEVKNLHAWARAFYEQRVGRRLAVLDKDERRRELMAQAGSVAAGEAFDTSFYLDEWDQVVQSQDVNSKESYFRARRLGRGTRLGRSQRDEVWSVLARYRELLDQEGLLEWQDVIREARLYLESHPNVLVYRAVLADEAQDFSPPELRLLRAMVPPGPNDLFLVGDAHQRIYGHMARLGACGIEIRGRSKRLKLNYRTTEQIRTQAVAILEKVEVDDLDGGVDSLAGYRSLRGGPVPVIHLCERPEEEERVIIETLSHWLESSPARNICIGARTNSLVDRLARVLSNAGIPHVKLKTEAMPKADGVRLATMHRLKGLEFKKVLLAGVQEGEVPLVLPDAAHSDAASAEDHEKRERCLLYVAATRARDELVITGFGGRSSLLPQE
jgi:mRNA-degrading endonuclease RelE of RelBE toxin-antitoxin system